jgi:hypothetical protein
MSALVISSRQVLLWASGQHLRVAFDHVVLAEYHSRYDWRDHKVQDIRAGLFHPTRVASPQLTLLPSTPQDSMVVSRARSSRGRACRSFPMSQLLLFEVVPAG